MSAEPNHYDDDGDFDDGTDDDEADDFDCGMTGEGLCMYAGTEWCDWECPFHEIEARKSLQIAALIAALIAANNVQTGAKK